LLYKDGWFVLIDAVMRSDGFEAQRRCGDVVWVQFRDEGALFEELRVLSKWQLVLLGKVVCRVREFKYVRRREALYGNLPRGLNVGQLVDFFEVVEPKYFDFFLLLFVFGLRIGEVKHLSVVKAQGLVRIENRKGGRVEYLPVIRGVEGALNALESLRCIKDKAARDAFRRAVKRAGLYYEYALSGNGKRLGQFTPHSLRHSAINLFAGYVKDPFKWMSFSRHEKSKLLGVSAVYRHYNLDELRADMEKVFKPVLEEVNKNG
jgi:integrase